jgi:hypothetical protein
VTRLLATSPDGQWAIARDGRTVLALAAGAGPPVGWLELPHDDVDLALVGPPNVLVAVVREGGNATVVLHELPHLEAVARVVIADPVRLAAVTGPRLVLAAPEAMQVTVVREAGRAVAQQKIDLASPIEFVVGLEKNQLLFGLLRKLEVWDAVSGRPLLRPQLPLPPPPRVLGAALGHLWAIQPDRDEVFVYRLSDGRPFRHYVGARIEDVICHPASPVIVLVTPRGLVRLHCYAHSLLLVDDAPWQPGTPLAQLVVGEDIALLGLPAGSQEPWRVGLGATGTPVTAPAPVAEEPAAAPLVTAADKLRAMRGEAASQAATPAAARTSSRVTWRDAVASHGHELARGIDAQPPDVAADTELGALVQRLGLSSSARRALISLYGLYLAGEPALAISRLARATGDWSEALGQGELADLAMLRRKHGKVALRTAVTDVLDGAGPRHVRLVGGGPTAPRAGAFRLARDGRADDAIEAELSSLLGLIAIVEGPIGAALLEARLHGATAIAHEVPDERPRPWPRDAGLVLVLYGSASSWVADLPNLTAS